MLGCPRCGVRLARQALAGQAHWVCESCGGHAINLAVLRKKIPPEAAYEVWRASNEGFPSRLNCPSCANGMVVAQVHLDGQELKVEVCRTCQFVWFDRKDLDGLPAPPPPPPVSKEKELPQEAREAMAIFETKRMAERAATESSGGAPDDGWKQALGWFGMPVEYDAAPLTRQPWATWILSAIILVVAVAGFFVEEVWQKFGFIPAEPFRLFGLTLVTSFLLHGGILHLVGNLYFLMAFGDNVEDLIGRKQFLALVAASALVGDLLHWMFDPSSTRPAVGASGGISGVIAFYALAFPKAQLGIVVRFFWVRFSAMWGFVLWVGIQFFTIYMMSEGRSSVAGTAHLGGALVGVAWWLALKPARPREPLLN